jgi:tetratricopeptide (TPR) repeat protein
LLKRDGQRLLEECRAILAIDAQHVATLPKPAGAGKDKPVGTASPKIKAEPGPPASGTAKVAVPEPKTPIRVSQPLAPAAPLPDFAERRRKMDEDIRARNHDKIVEIKDQAQHDADNGAAQFLAGVRLMRYKASDDAKSYFEQAVALDPNLAEAHFHLAQIALQNGDVQAGVTYLENAIEVNPQNSKYQSILALTLVEAGDPGQAFEFAKKAAQVDPENAEAHYVMARVLVQNQRKPEAQEAIAKGLAAEAVAPCNLAEALKALQDELQ